MNCAEVQKQLVGFLDNEVAPGERRLIQQHLAGCRACRQRLSALTETRQSVTRALQSRAAHAQPSPQAWRLLQARLAQEGSLPEPRNPEAPPAPAWNTEQPTRRSLRHWFTGEHTMRTRMLFPALALVVFVLAAAFLMTQDVLPVSAQQVLDRAAAQAGAAPTEGIQHIRTEIYTNIEMASGEQAGTLTSVESYMDLATRASRLVVTDLRSGQVWDVSGFDGRYTYTSRRSENGQPVSPLTIYRVPQDSEKVVKEPLGESPDSARQIFEQARSNPTTENLGKQTLDGRAVYVLRFRGQVKVLVNGAMERPEGTTRMVFDAASYALIETRTTVQQNGQDVLILSMRSVNNEVLPAGTPVTWDLSDLKGATFVDDPQGKQGDSLPEVISSSDLAVKAQAYVLAPIPNGFEQTISAAPNQDANQDFAYVVSYRTPAGDYFVIQPAAGMTREQAQKNFSAGSYTTARGIVAYFGEDLKAQDGKAYVRAAFFTPEGQAFLLNSTLPLAQVKALAETLAAVKG